MKSIVLKLWKDESGQGTAEYVLILVGVLAVAYVFKDRIQSILGEKMDAVKKNIMGFTRSST